MTNYSGEEICVICGAPVPEGRMVCAICEAQIEQDLEQEENMCQKQLVDT